MLQAILKWKAASACTLVKTNFFHQSCDCNKQNLPMSCTASFGSNCGSSLFDSLSTFWKHYTHFRPKYVAS